MAEHFAQKPTANNARILHRTHKEYKTVRLLHVSAKQVEDLFKQEKNEAKERKKCILYLILSYLRDYNLEDTADALRVEAQLGNQFEVCDNVDLDIMLQDYQSYYYTKFNKEAKIIRKLNLDVGAGDCKSTPSKRKIKSTHPSTTQLAQQKLPKDNQSSPKAPAQHPENETDFRIDVTNLGGSQKPSTKEKEVEDTKPDLPALSDFDGYSSDWRDLADLITKEIVPKNMGTRWASCVGVDESVELLREAVVYPSMYPDLFTGLLTPWKGVLLYGPPGTGKTLLARALACESSATFINLTISTFVSKWRGDSEKLLKVLFDVARLYAPTIIFIDELDALASKFEDSQHDASRRFKSELLVQMDGLLAGDDQIFVLATTNMPWNLNGAILRRFEKRILLNVPSKEARVNLFRHYLNKHQNDFTDCDFRWMAEATDEYSGADIKHVCKEVLMIAVREKLGQMRGLKTKSDNNRPRSSNLEDVRLAISKVRPTNCAEVIERHVEWAGKYGSL